MQDTYYPRYLGVAIPKGEKIYEFLITGNEQIGVLASVAQLLASHRIDLNMVNSYSLHEPDRFVFNIYADLARADCTPTQLADELKKINAVTTVEFFGASGALYNHFLFPVIMTNGTRAVIMLSSALVNVEAHFARSLGQQGKHLVFESGRQAGLTIVKDTRKQLPKSSAQELLKHIEDRLRAAGWGLFAFDISAMEKGEIEVSVIQPIFSEIEEIQESWYTYGLSAGVMEGIFGSSLVLATSSYKRDTKTLSFKLQEQAEKGRPLKGMR